MAKINGVDSVATYAFTALGSAASNVTGDGTTYTVIYGTVIENDGNCYNSSTGYFTAPFDGWYSFSGSVYVNGITSSQAGIQLGFYLAGVNYYWQIVCDANKVATGGGLIMNGSITMYMTKDQQMSVAVLCYGSSKVVDVVAGHGTFSGHYLG